MLNKDQLFLSLPQLRVMFFFLEVLNRPTMTQYLLSARQVRFLEVLNGDLSTSHCWLVHSTRSLRILYEFLPLRILYEFFPMAQESEQPDIDLSRVG